jgi:hypothetical protein
MNSSSCECNGRCDANDSEGVHGKACGDDAEVTYHAADGQTLRLCYPCYAEIEYVARVRAENARPGPARLAATKTVADFVIASHGPHVVTLIPHTARADRFLDAHVSYDPDFENYCGGGLLVERGELPELLALIKAEGLNVI